MGLGTTEGLQFIDTNRFGVAFLAQTLTLKGEDVVLAPRHQPLKCFTIYPPDRGDQNRITKDQRANVPPSRRRNANDS